jgi:anaerobic selenocysteine-containing dehydrogenase
MTTIDATTIDATSTDATSTDVEPTWHKSACILCECNCGVEIRLGSDGHTFERIRGDKSHPASKGYTCEKALRLDHYQNGRGERVLNPLRRRDDGTFEEVDWDTAAREVAERLGAVRDEFGGDKIIYYGGGGQGNHLCGAYGAALHKGFGGRYRSSAIGQEKSGEVWVNGVMFGNAVRGEFDDCEVAFFIGKNPWMSHGIPRARTTLKAIAKDEQRSMVVIDPRVTETAELADFHLQVAPGRDAWLLAAMVAVIVQEGLAAHAWLGEHAVGLEAVNERFAAIDVAEFCVISGVEEDLVRRATRRLAAASSVAAFEDLGIQMNRHSTLVSYLEKLVWTLTGNFANHGGQQIPSTMVPLVKAYSVELDPERAPRTPVAGERIFAGLVPCNVMPEEILTDHPDRYRAMIVESGNPAHSVADSSRMRGALRALDFVLVIDVFMTETAREADYVLPATTQFEKFESTFFNFEFPKNVFHLRRPVVEPPDGPLAEPEIHARILEAAGMIHLEARLEPGALRILQLLVADLAFQNGYALRRYEFEEERIVDPGRRITVGKQEFVPYQGRNEGHAALLKYRDKIGIHFPVANIVGEDIQAAFNEHLRVGELVDVAEGEFSVLARLIQDRSAELGGKFGPGAKSAIDPDLDVIGARGDGLIDLQARLFRCHDLGVGCEPILHCGYARAAQLAALLRFPDLDNLLRIGLHAGHRGHTVKRVLAQLRLGFRSDVPVGVDDARRDELASEIHNDGGGRHRDIRRRPHIEDAAVFEDQGHILLWRRARAVDDGRVGENRHLSCGGGSEE